MNYLSWISKSELSNHLAELSLSNNYINLLLLYFLFSFTHSFQLARPKDMVEFYMARPSFLFLKPQAQIAMVARPPLSLRTTFFHQIHIPPQYIQKTLGPFHVWLVRLCLEIKNRNFYVSLSSGNFKNMLWEGDKPFRSGLGEIASTLYFKSECPHDHVENMLMGRMNRFPNTSSSTVNY
jgi:hypothetical protein